MPNQRYFPVPDGRKVYAKLDVATGEIISRSAHWPAFPDDTPIVGDDGSTRYLAIIEDPNPIEYDSDLYSVVVSEVVGASTFYVQRKLVKRDVEELKTRAKNYESFHRASIMPPQELSARAIIGLALVFKSAKNIILTPEEQAYVDSEIVTIASKLTENAAILSDKLAQLDQGQEPDLKAEWVKS